VLRRDLLTSTSRHSHRERNCELAARHVPHRGGVVHDLIESKQAEVDRHHFDDGAHPSKGGADARSDERRFAKWRVANSLFAELFEQALALQSGHENPSHTVFALSQVGAFCVLLGRHREALLLHGASDAIAEGLGITGPAVSMAAIMADAATARLALGPDADAVEVQGRSLSIAEAADLARRVLTDAQAFGSDALRARN